MFSHLKIGIAHFQKEWQTGARMGSRSFRGSFGDAFARAKTFSLTQVKFQFNNEQKFKYCMKTDENAETKRLKTVPKSWYTHKKTFWHFFLPFCFSIFKVSVSVQVLLREREILARATAPPNDPIIERAPILTPVCHSF